MQSQTTMTFFLFSRSARRPPSRLAGIMMSMLATVTTLIVKASSPSFWLRIIVSMGQTIEPRFVTMRPKNNI